MAFAAMYTSFPQVMQGSSAMAVSRESCLTVMPASPSWGGSPALALCTSWPKPTLCWLSQQGWYSRVYASLIPCCRLAVTMPQAWGPHTSSCLVPQLRTSVRSATAPTAALVPCPASTLHTADPTCCSLASSMRLFSSRTRWNSSASTRAISAWASTCTEGHTGPWHQAGGPWGVGCLLTLGCAQGYTTSVWAK